MATLKPDLTRVWANGAPPANVVDPDNTTPGKVDAGWQAEVPPFEHFNFLQKWFTQGLAHFNEQGIAVWDANTTYPIGGIAKGSNKQIYEAVQEQSGNDPVSDDGTNWVVAMPSGIKFTSDILSDTSSRNSFVSEFYDSNEIRNSGAKWVRDGTIGTSSTTEFENGRLYNASGDGYSIVYDKLTLSKFGDDISELENVLSFAGYNIVRLTENTTYESTEAVVLSEGNILDLNGATINLTTNLPLVAAIDIQADNVEVFGGTINVVASDFTGLAKGASCVTAGNQQNGDGFSNIRIHDLIVSTNRNNAGGPITILGGCSNVEIHDITIPDNLDILFGIACEWGGKTPGQITGHPHNIKIYNINIGKMTAPPPPAVSFTGAVWLSSCFNVQVSNINMEEGNGLVGVNKGDLGSSQAPASYKSLVGTGIRVSDCGIEKCTHNALWVFGETDLNGARMPVVFDSIRATSANGLAYGLRNIHTTGLRLLDSYLDGFLQGVNQQNDVIDTQIKGCKITNSEENGIQGGTDTTTCKGLRVENCSLYRNNRGLSTSRVTGAAISLYNTTDSEVVGCIFEDTSETATQRHSITGALSSVNPSIHNNITYKTFVDQSPYWFGETTDYGINLRASNNINLGVAVAFSGSPAYEFMEDGTRRFMSSSTPASGTWKNGDTFYYKGAAASFIGGVYKAGVWSNFGAIV